MPNIVKSNSSKAGTSNSKYFTISRATGAMQIPEDINLSSKSSPSF